jgi:two-component system, OmpR family, sensor kinase
MHLPRTLRARLAAATAASILAAVVLFAVIAVLVVGSQLRGSLDSALRARAQDVAELAVTDPGVLGDPGALETPVSGRQLAVEVIDAHGRLLASSLALGAEVLPQDSLVRAALRQGRAGLEDISLNGQPFRMFVAPIADVTGPAAGGAVLVASDTSDIAHTLGNLGVVVALSGVGVVLLAALAAALLTRRVLHPLRRLAEAAGEIERTADPSRRLPAPQTLDEIGQLTGVLNRMLASLEQARAGERRFLADASHELRTPVTSLLGNVEYAVRHGAEPDVLHDLRDDATRLARLVDALLALERAGATAADRQVQLDTLARDVVAAHDGRRVTVGELAAVEVDGDRDALRRMLENLVENGLVHGPAEGLVTVTVAATDGAAIVTVRDEGPGPDPMQRDRLFERFWRAPEASGRPGSGLGLSIAAAIVERYRGTITVDGSEFTVRLPRRPGGAP